MNSTRYSPNRRKLVKCTQKTKTKSWSQNIFQHLRFANHRQGSNNGNYRDRQRSYRGSEGPHRIVCSRYQQMGRVGEKCKMKLTEYGAFTLWCPLRKTRMFFAKFSSPSKLEMEIVRCWCTCLRLRVHNRFLYYVTDTCARWRESWMVGNSFTAEFLSECLLQKFAYIFVGGDDWDENWVCMLIWFCFKWWWMSSDAWFWLMCVLLYSKRSRNT